MSSSHIPQVNPSLAVPLPKRSSKSPQGVTRIVVGEQTAAPVLQAASLLRGYLARLFDRDGLIISDSSREHTDSITLRVADKSEHESLSTQGYVLRHGKGGRRGYEIVGGSPIAVLWGVAELAEFWGVRFLTYRDLFPDDPGSYRFPLHTIRREPTIPLRGVRLYNDWPNDPCQWPARDYDALLDQLAKMRVNQVLMTARPCDPFFHLQWRGAGKDCALVNYGLKLPVNRDMVGYDLFQESGDAARGRFSNPDLSDHKSYQEAILAGERYFQHIVDASHQRGMKLAAMVVITDFPESIKRRLVELSHGQFKMSDPGGAVTRIRYGQWTEGATPEIALAMSIRNPLYLDLARHALQSYIDAFENCDQLYLWPSEFRNTDADVKYAWDDLDRRYQISDILAYDDLIEKARSRAEIDADRAEHEVKSDICLLWLFDYLLNQHPVRTGAGSPQIVPGGMNADLNRYIPRVLADHKDYLASLGYMPTSINRWADTLEVADDNADDKQMRFSVMITTEDDNVGPFPQYSSPSIQKTVESICEHQGRGYFTRQWNYAKTLPSLHYLTHASWQAGLDIEESHRHLFGSICGELALTPLLDGIRRLESLTTLMHCGLDCLAFLSPHIVTGRWNGHDSAYFGHTDSIKRLEQIHSEVLAASQQFRSAKTDSLPSGKALVDKMHHHAMFGVKWIKALIAMAHASRHHRESLKADKLGDTETFDVSLIKATEELANARDLFIKATEHWARCVEDRCDLGVLAALNEYAIIPIRAIHHLTYIDSIHWSKTQ